MGLGPEGAAVRAPNGALGALERSVTLASVNSAEAATQRAAARTGGRTRVAVLGGGTVGGETVRILQEFDDLEVLGVLVRDVAKPRAFADWRELVTTDAAVAEDADIVVEVMGGTDLATDLALAALERGAAVVSANKASLAERWQEYLPALEAGRVHFEAAVMAGTPVIGPLSGALRGSRPVALQAVLNGTCNVILSAMEQGTEYDVALAAAQAAGFAEADPTLDVEGLDAAHKLTILARLAFDPHVAWEDVAAATTGISGVDAKAVAEQLAAGRRLRLIGDIRAGDSGWSVSVAPLPLPAGHPLVTEGAGNGLTFSGDPLGEVVIRGPGAGAGATASAVVADVLAAAAGRPGPTPLKRAADHRRAGGSRPGSRPTGG